MSRSLYVVAPEGRTGKSAIALGLLDALVRQAGSVAVFRPLYDGTGAVDPILDLLVNQPGVVHGHDAGLGVSYERMRRDPDEAMTEIVDRFAELSEQCDVVLVVGSDYTDVSTPTELSVNAQIAAHLGTPVVLVVHGRDRTAAEIADTAGSALTELRSRHDTVVAVVANRVEPDLVDAVRDALAGLGDDGQYVVAALPESPVLSAPTVGALVQAAGAALVMGSPDGLATESLGLIVAAMSLPNVLDRLTAGATVITASDRADLIPGLVLAHRSGTFPALAGLVLTGGYPIPDTIRRLVEGVGSELPIALAQGGTFETAERLVRVPGPLTKTSTAKIETARRLFAEQVDAEALLRSADVGRPTLRTPLMFEHQLAEQARRHRRRIVLPEGTEDRILQAAAIVLRRGLADVTILGEPADVLARAEQAGGDVSSAQVISNHDPELVERFAAEYARLRAERGVTLDQARDTVTDVSYFGTMMVHLGLADGMVSGSVNTTAHTIRPSFEIIRTRPGVEVVSSVFLMCLSDRVLVYGDCAVIPDPTAEQLADIALSSAETALRFGIEPRVAMLSYSTGSSGSGAEVEKVRAATALAQQRRPDLLLEGPLQYDAAIDPDVARTKLPGSVVAGRATVFIFPDLNTGNNTYKAVQRSAGAVAIGPVLQGLNRPVNDLSRGATVDDIVNTIAITAIQAADSRSADR